VVVLAFPRRQVSRIAFEVPGAGKQGRTLPP
jgi:hypothetical protein